MYREAPLADAERYRHVPARRVSYQIDRNVNYTNVCLSGCKFCNFHCRPDEPEKAYTLALEDYLPTIAEMKALGGDQLLLQGGLHPKYGIDWYETLFKRLKEAEPSLKLNALGPPEIAHIARISRLTYREVLERLRAAGLDTLPGAGAEIQHPAAGGQRGKREHAAGLRLAAGMASHLSSSARSTEATLPSASSSGT